MRLNPDCIRDILLTVEEFSEFGSIIQYNTSENFPLLVKYSEDEFLYHVNQCKYNGYFLYCNISARGDSVLIGNLSPKAHEFLENIRDDNNYKKVKAILLKTGSFALTFIPQIAAKVVQNNIDKLF